MTAFAGGTHTGTRPVAKGGLCGETGALRGVWVSDEIPAPQATFAIASWNATAPTGTWTEVEVCARLGDVWTQWYTFGRWSAGPDRGSLSGQKDECGRLDTDTLVLNQGADALRVRVTLEGRAELHRLYLLVASAGTETLLLDPIREAWGADLAVPARSQLNYSNGGVICSPTSLGMVLAYWGTEVSIPDALVPAVYDPVYKGHGNWPFNTAVAGLYGLEGYITRMYGLPQLEAWILAGVPVVVSVKYNRQWMEGAPGDTNGHILVVRGFTPSGDVIVNDPWFPSDAQVRAVYKRDQFDRAWAGSGRVAYLIHPAGHPIPGNSRGAW